MWFFLMFLFGFTIVTVVRMSGLISPDGGLRSHIGGGSGGYLEHVMRYAVSQINGSSVENLQYKTMR